MSLLTSFLNLFKYEATDEGNFNIQEALNDNWDKVDAKAKEIEEALMLHIETKEIHHNDQILEENFLNLLIERELQGMASDMDVGYWWDTFGDESKIFGKVNINIDSPNNIANLMSDTGEIITQEIDLEFITNQIRLFFLRSDVNENIISKTNVPIGYTQLVVDPYSVTISEV